MGAVSRTEPVRATVVTPSLNQGAWIGDALESVRSQTYPFVEHLVVDGGSTDKTLAVLKAASAGSSLAWNSAPDRGMYEAINKGIRQARGTIVCYLNADDLLAPWAVEAAVEVFLAHPEVDVVYGDAVELADGRPSSLKLQVPFQWERIVRYGSLVQPAVFWRRDVATRVGSFDSDLQFVGDLDYWLRIGKSGRFHHLDEVLAAYRVHSAAKTSRFRTDMRQEELQMRIAHDSRRRGRMLHQLRARISHGWAVRVQLLRFVASIGSGADARWGRFRVDGDPAGDRLQWALALLPLAGRLGNSAVVRVRRGWLARFESTKR